MVYGGSVSSLTHGLGDTGGKYVWPFWGDTDLFPWTKGFANTLYSMQYLGHLSHLCLVMLFSFH